MKKMSLIFIILICLVSCSYGQVTNSNDHIPFKLPDGLNTLIAISGAVIAMISGLWFIFQRLKKKDQGFGQNSIKVIGLILFLPTILIISILSGLQTETLAALLGTIAGYVLSNSKSEGD